MYEQRQLEQNCPSNSLKSKILRVWVLNRD